MDNIAMVTKVMVNDYADSELKSSSSSASKSGWMVHHGMGKLLNRVLGCGLLRGGREGVRGCSERPNCLIGGRAHTHNHLPDDHDGNVENFPGGSSYCVQWDCCRLLMVMVVVMVVLVLVIVLASIWWRWWQWCGQSWGEWSLNCLIDSSPLNSHCQCPMWPNILSLKMTMITMLPR